MLGFYENFPVNIHRVEAFMTSLSTKRLQRRLIQVLHDINRRKLSFEEVAYPTVPECTIIFEAGLADAESFNYIDDEETRKVLTALAKAPFQTMDFFCAVRYTFQSMPSAGSKITRVRFYIAHIYRQKLSAGFVYCLHYGSAFHIKPLVSYARRIIADIEVLVFIFGIC